MEEDPYLEKILKGGGDEPMLTPILKKKFKGWRIPQKRSTYT